MTVTDPQIDLLVRLLDAATLRHQTIAQNVANASTPGYHRQEVEFEESLIRQLAERGTSAGWDVAPKIVTRSGDEKPDGNNVDVDLEMGNLNKNALLYSTYVQILSHKLALMRSAISGH